ncbi:MAG: UDP-N-acetylglucosamine 1-carboxyvinyltransferase [Deltaproteobacteria bacterium]|nr:UDP-N-acetylglucosamine 1-carboxyvinyltransferase [Deltaproteobacteria bacterium]MBW2070100.1 UDP-N-acetylglucosamine 1-carboxyvinyltransferase [Deltaproteobacteria bacterium]
MEKLIIRGGSPLKGTVQISGAKNAALPILAATLLTGGVHHLSRLPTLRDIRTTKTLLYHLGATFDEGEPLRIHSENIDGYEAPYDLVKTMRASVLVLGPLVARMKRARVSLPGGCAIGARPINLHLYGLERLGVSIELRHGYVEASARKLIGNHIYLDIPTVTGTENLMMAAVLAEGETILENAAREPEVVDLAVCLNSMGARITGAGTSLIKIEGVKELRPMNHAIMPDRIEAGTYLVAAAITRGDITIQPCRPQHLEAVIRKLEQAGVQFHIASESIRAIGGEVVRHADVKTMPFPGFPTDMQAQFMALMSIADGQSTITERIFENRFMHVSELRRMGADITVEGNTAIVRGRANLQGAPVMATDLRASASLVLAGLAANGVTEVSRVYHLDRGYEKIETKLTGLGANIERVAE